MAHQFATSICCMDGRIQVPIYSWLKKNHRIDFVDTITEPGVDRLFNDIVSIKSIKTKVLISVNKHGSKTILVSGHHDCAGNPVSKKQHQTQIKNAVSVIESWNLPVSVIGAWVNENWQVEVMPR